MRPAHTAAGLLSLLAAATLALAACGGDGGPSGGAGSGATCPAGGTALTYAGFAASFFDTYCTSCHGTPPSNGAPAHADFTTLAAIQDHAHLIDAKAAAGTRVNTVMPPGGGPSVAERRQLGEWLACGAPP